jgi:hypothetical protein
VLAASVIEALTLKNAIGLVLIAIAWLTVLYVVRLLRT